MASAVENHAPASVSPSIWIGFAMMCIGMFMAVLDVQVVATSLPTIQQSLNIAQDAMSWIQTAYLIAEIVSIPLTGFLMRILTMRWLFFCAVTLFTLASIGCATSDGFSSLIAYRALQGFAGGTLIPSVFSAVFLLFPTDKQPLATMIAGVLAVLAPTAGPIVGGWITQAYSWPWLFLINVPSGLAAAAIATLTLPRGRTALGQLRHLDVVSLAVGGIALASLEIAIKEAPDRGWASALVMGLFALSAIGAAGCVFRTLRSPNPLVELRTFLDRNFSVACITSFVLGMGLFGSVYLMPVFLAYVRNHDALEIGKIMLVTGVAQLAAAPLAVSCVKRFDERVLAAIGFLLFSIGLALSSLQTKNTDFNEMLIPQSIRGFAIMFCILPPTQLALSRIARATVADASGLFNMMRNLGGAIGIALIDTVVYSRTPDHAHILLDHLMHGDLATAQLIGIPPEMFGGSLLDPVSQAMLKPMVQRVAFTDAINDAWALIAFITLGTLLVVPLARRQLP